MLIIAPNPILSEKAKAVLKACLPAGKAGKSILHTIAKMRDTLSSAHDPIGVGLAAPQIGKSLQIFIAKPTPKSKVSVFINPKIIRGGEVERLPTARTFALRSGVLAKGALAGRKPRQDPESVADQSDHARLEGCLSLPSIWGEVKREEKIKLSFLDDTGKRHTQTFKGLLATIIQHEIDHLNGVLFTKRVLEQKGKLYKSRKNRKGEEVFERLQLV